MVACFPESLVTQKYQKSRSRIAGVEFLSRSDDNWENPFKEHVILEIVHTARDRSYETNACDPEYNNAFTAIPSRVPATPHRTTPRPRIDGTQIALVAGPEGEEIHPDDMAASSCGSTSGRMTA
jgi:type VI secretion system secreted protein VgrG